MTQITQSCAVSFYTSIKSSSSCRLSINKLIAVVVLFAQDVGPVNAMRTVNAFMALDQLSGSHFSFDSK